MTASEIRQSFLDFFKERGHRVVPSAPVVPSDDPTLLFTNAGMNQFKDVFLGTGSRPYTRAVDAQKCIRVSGKHNDLEEVGYDTYHHTFFEMMGNWSFGDYYKKEAIAWAWELVTSVWGLPKDRLWATVFREDDEAEALWKKMTDIRPSQVLRFGEKDNFWEMGEVGPCGPCSEIHIDMGKGHCDRANHPGHVCGVNAGCSRFIELWNLVFIQFNRDESGAVKQLPERHVDTGLGLERAVAVLQGKKSNYDTDLFMPVIRKIAGITGRPVEEPTLLPSFRVIADHIRALVFAVTDGAIPSNDGRGYVLRRILRRAARYGRKLGMHEPFIHTLVGTVVDMMGGAYPEIRERAEHTALVIKAEEERFNDVLDRGIELFEKLVTDLEGRKKTHIPGDEVFRLYDTYGFPVDLTQLMAREKGLTVDVRGFEDALEKQREKARQAGKFSMEEKTWDEVTRGADSRFVGYETTEARATIRKIRREDGQYSILLDVSPFYGEAGGQVGDTGTISGKDFSIRVENTQRQGDRIVHLGRLVSGDRVAEKDVLARVDADRRLATARNHTATHLLHRALREVLGSHVHQAGSFVAPDRFRFDFTHFEAMTPSQIDTVEEIVNRHVREDLPVEKYKTTLEKAKADGAVALFGEKYGESVRVIKIDAVSMELCGGTHIDRTGQIGYFRILREEGISAGVRRIEAVTGEEACRVLMKEKNVISRLEEIFKCAGEELEDRALGLLEERKKLEKKVKSTHRMAAASELDEMLGSAVNVGGISVLARKVESPDADELRTLGDRLRGALKSGVGVLASVMEGKGQFLCVVTDDLIASGPLRAGDIVRLVAREAGGSGGGRPHLAMAGGDPGKLQAALDKVPEIVLALLKGLAHTS